MTASPVLYFLFSSYTGTSSNCACGRFLVTSSGITSTLPFPFFFPKKEFHISPAVPTKLPRIKSTRGTVIPPINGNHLGNFTLGRLSHQLVNPSFNQLPSFERLVMAASQSSFNLLPTASPPPPKTNS